MLLAPGGTLYYPIWLLDATTGKEVGRLHGHHDAIHRLVLSPDSKTLYSSTDGQRGYLGQLVVWDVAARRGLLVLGASDWSLTVDGNKLVTLESVSVPWVGPAGGLVPRVDVSRPVVRFRDTRTWKETEAFAAPVQQPEWRTVSLAVSPDGRYVALGGSDAVVRVWDRQERKELPPLTDLTHKPAGEPAHYLPAVTRLVFSPDGKALAGASGGTLLVQGTRHVALWEWPGGKLAHRLTLDSYDLTTLAFAPDGHHLLTIGRRPTVWDVSTGAVHTPAVQPKGSPSFSAAAFAPDGRRLYVPGKEGRLELVSFPDLTPVPLAPGE
jgi:WD40 repeat protein